MEEEIVTAQPEQEATVEVVDIQFRQGQKVYFFDPAGFDLRAGDHVIIDTARGPEFGICAGGNHAIRQKDVVAPLRSVIRVATAQDERIVADNQEKEKRAFAVCQQKISDFGLDMQLVSAECAFDGGKILFFFTADERVDFRELVKSLASAFHTRIELRQIGVRDKAKMVGGLGICGRPFCCASFLEDFQPVSIKMAKTQNLSLNPTKISGTCGRLMCCLKYEQEAYEDLLRTSPKPDSFVDTPQGRGTVVEVNLLRQQVRVRMETQPDTINTFANADIAVLRNGKARKNDPPIPPDLAPISGGGKQAPKAPEEAPMTLEPIRFRYSTEQIVEETTSEETPEAPPGSPAAPDAKASGRRRKKPAENQKDNPDKSPQPRKDKQPPKQEKAAGKGEKQPKPEKPRQPRPEKQPAGEAAGGETAQKPRRQNNYRRPRKPRPQTDGGGKTE